MQLSPQAQFLIHFVWEAATFDSPLAPDEKRQRLRGSVAAETEQKIAALIG